MGDDGADVGTGRDIEETDDDKSEKVDEVDKETRDSKGEGDEQEGDD